jgi:hypothetical protein
MSNVSAEIAVAILRVNMEMSAETLDISQYSTRPVPENWILHWTPAAKT